VQQAFGVSDIANTVHVGIFKIRRALGYREIRQVRHEPLNVAFKEAHGQHVLYTLHLAQEQANLGQILAYCHGIFSAGKGMRRDRESAQHFRVAIAHFFLQIVDQDGTRLFR